MCASRHSDVDVGLANVRLLQAKRSTAYTLGKSPRRSSLRRRVQKLDFGKVDVASRRSSRELGGGGGAFLARGSCSPSDPGGVCISMVTSIALA